MFQPRDQPDKSYIPLLRSFRFLFHRRSINISSLRDWVCGSKKRFRLSTRAIGLSRLVSLTIAALFLAIAIFNTHPTVHATNEPEQNKHLDEKTPLIEQALFMRAEFFGAQALVPYPTAE